MSSVVTVHQNNLDACVRALAELHSNLDALARLTEKYPVEVEFGGMRFIFASRADIEKLQQELQKQINQFRAR